MKNIFVFLFLFSLLSAVSLSINTFEEHDDCLMANTLDSSDLSAFLKLELPNFKHSQNLESLNMAIFCPYKSPSPSSLFNRTHRPSTIELEQRFSLAQGQTVKFEWDSQFKLASAPVVQSPSPWFLGAIANPTEKFPTKDDLIKGNLISSSFPVKATGKGVRFYVLDTEVDATHQEFSGASGSRVTLGNNFFAGTSGASAANGTGICRTHGTMVMSNVIGGTLGASKEATGKSVVVAGCSGRADKPVLAKVNVLLQGIDWVIQDVLANKNAGGNVIVMSISVQDSSSLLNQAIKAANDKAGIIIVAAAGNDNSDSCLWNGIYSSSIYSGGKVPLINVGAISVDKQRTSFSNWGHCIDIFALGDGLLGAIPASSAPNSSVPMYDTFSGTSASAAHVAGVVGWFLELNPSASFSDISHSLVNDGAVSGQLVRNSLLGSPDLLLSTSNIQSTANVSSTVLPAANILSVVAGLPSPLRFDSYTYSFATDQRYNSTPLIVLRWIMLAIFVLMVAALSIDLARHKRVLAEVAGLE